MEGYNRSASLSELGFTRDGLECCAAILVGNNGTISVIRRRVLSTSGLIPGFMIRNCVGYAYMIELRFLAAG